MRDLFKGRTSRTRNTRPRNARWRPELRSCERRPGCNRPRTFATMLPVDRETRTNSRMSVVRRALARKLFFRDPQTPQESLALAREVSRRSTLSGLAPRTPNGTPPLTARLARTYAHAFAHDRKAGRCPEHFAGCVSPFRP